MNLIFNIIIAAILHIVLIFLMHNVIVGVRTKDDRLTVLCGIGSGLVGIFLGIALGRIIFNI